MQNDIRTHVISLLESYPDDLRKIRVLRYELEQPQQIGLEAEAAVTNTASTGKIMQKLLPLEREVNRLIHYISLLPKREQRVLQLHYFEQMPWSEISATMQLSLRTVQNTLKSAVAHLSDFYSLLEDD